jgi:DNA-binding GntR family transcriptional regulator
VEYVAQRGAIVRPVSPEEISQIYDVRILLEGYAAKLAATRAQPRDLLAAEGICASLQAVMKDDSNSPDQVSKLIELNNRFHTAITDMSGNVVLARILKVVLQVPQIYRAYYWYDKSNRARTNQMHQCVLDAIRERDSVKAEQLMQQHLMTAQDLILKVLERIDTFPASEMP